MFERLCTDFTRMVYSEYKKAQWLQELKKKPAHVVPRGGMFGMLIAAK